ELAEGDLAVLGLRGVLIVDQPPDEVEDLLAHDPGEDAGGDADRPEDEPHQLRLLPRSMPMLKAARPTRASRCRCAWSISWRRAASADGGIESFAVAVSSSFLASVVLLTSRALPSALVLTSRAFPVTVAWALTSVLAASSATVSPNSVRVFSISSRTCSGVRSCGVSTFSPAALWPSPIARPPSRF